MHRLATLGLFALPLVAAQQSANTMMLPQGPTITTIIQEPSTTSVHLHMIPSSAPACGANVVCDAKGIVEEIDVYNSTVFVTNTKTVPFTKVITQTHTMLSIIVEEVNPVTTAPCITNVTVTRNVILTKTVDIDVTETAYQFPIVHETSLSTITRTANSTSACVIRSTGLGRGPGTPVTTTTPSTKPSATPVPSDEDDEEDDEFTIQEDRVHAEL